MKRRKFLSDLTAASGIVALGLFPTISKAAESNREPDDDWSFDISKQDQSTAAGCEWEFKPEGGDWKTISVPTGGWRAQGYQCDAGTYRTWIAIPKNVQGRRARLNFDAINFGADIFAGPDAASLVRVAHHVDGWLPVTADLTPFGKPGGKVLVQVEVAGRKKFIMNGKYTVPEGATWFPGLAEGIIRGVHLELLPPVRIESVFVQTRLAPDILSAEVLLVNDTDNPVSATLVSKIQSAGPANFHYPAIPDLTVSLPARSSRVVELPQISWNLGEKSYWWPNVPYRARYRAQLHELHLDLHVAGKIVPFNQRFGFRQFQAVGAHYELNGVHCNLRGDNQQEANFGTDAYGTRKGFGPPTPENPGWPQAVDNWQRLNFNVMRIHQIPATPYMLDVCDEKGLMLVAESPLRGSEGGEDYASGKSNMLNMDRELVLRDRNHPAIVIWSAANEWKDPIRDAMAVIREVDPTRVIIADGIEDIGPDVINMNHYVNGLGGMPANGAPPRTDRPYGETEAIWPADNSLQGFAWMATTVRLRRLKGNSDLRNYVLNNAWPNYVPGESSQNEILETAVKNFGNGSKTILPDITDPWANPNIRLLQQCYDPLTACDVDFDERNVASNDKGEWPVMKPKLPANTTVIREIAIFNDELAGSKMALHWEIRRDDRHGKGLKTGKENMHIPPGEFRIENISFPTPSSGEIALVLEVYKDGHKRFTEDKMIFQITTNA
ncbi:MAG TPA: glycoside hydrolase family 2 TIM barrel-domain containing protein [Candidatus Acidoferrum sp.]|nr:glycoside hydrolase family 2 TIM barrel-domain containing protein [Candidatus Acidoferrum sp.]